VSSFIAYSPEMLVSDSKRAFCGSLTAPKRISCKVASSSSQTENLFCALGQNRKRARWKTKAIFHFRPSHHNKRASCGNFVEIRHHLDLKMTRP
jgi:hypothetical protein